MIRTVTINVCGMSGIGLIGAGAWQLSPAWALIAVGVIVLILSIVGALR